MPSSIEEYAVLSSLVREKRPDCGVMPEAAVIDRFARQLVCCIIPNVFWFGSKAPLTGIHRASHRRVLANNCPTFLPASQSQLDTENLLIVIQGIPRIGKTLL